MTVAYEVEGPTPGGPGSLTAILGHSAASVKMNWKPFLMESGWGLGLVCSSVTSVAMSTLSCVSGQTLQSAMAVGKNMSAPVSLSLLVESIRKLIKSTAAVSVMAKRTVPISAV